MFPASFCPVWTESQKGAVSALLFDVSGEQIGQLGKKRAVNGATVSFSTRAQPQWTDSTQMWLQSHTRYPPPPHPPQSCGPVTEQTDRFTDCEVCVRPGEESDVAADDKSPLLSLESLIENIYFVFLQARKTPF